MRKIAYIILLACMAVTGYAQDAESAEAHRQAVAERNAEQGFNDTIDRLAPDFVTASLVVTDPGKVLYQVVGHACIRLQCPTFGLDYCFSYESESVRDKVITFLRGKLKMGMFAIPMKDFCSMYAKENRKVREYVIHLSPEQKQDLWRIMDEQVALGANMPYDYFHKGCAKSVILLMEKAVGKDAIHYAPWPEKYTMHTQRELLADYITDRPWSEFILHFLGGIDGDKDYPPLRKVIIPSDLVEVWQQATLDGMQLLDEQEHVLVDANRKPPYRGLTPTHIAIVLLILALLSLATLFVPCLNTQTLRLSAKIVNGLILLTVTLLGLLETYLVLFSDLCCTDWNWLLIAYNPLPLIFWHWRRYWALGYAGVLAAWCIAMAAYPHLLVDISQIILACAMIVVLCNEFVAARKSARTQQAD